MLLYPLVGICREMDAQTRQYFKRSILRKDLLRRDQIWFAEKSSEGASDLYSLVEYKINQANSVRNDASFSKDYLLGRYGAIPYFGNIDKFIMEYGSKKEE